MNLRNYLMIMKARREIHSQCAMSQPCSACLCASCFVHMNDKLTRINSPALCAPQSVLAADWSWTDICPVAESGVDCLIDEAGTVDELLSSPLPLGNVLDYGADPTGAPLDCIALLWLALSNVEPSAETSAWTIDTLQLYGW